MSDSPCLLLLLALEGLPLPWDALGSMPFVRGLLPQAACGAWAGPAPGDERQVWRDLCAGPLWEELRRAKVTAGLFNLPGTWPPPEVAGWVVPRLEAPEQARRASWPPELALDLADYLTGQVALLKRPAPKPQQRDEAFAHWACLARLVWEHAHRLLEADRPALAGVGFQGFDEVARMFAGEPARVALLLAQVDHYLGHLAELLAPRAILCLAGGDGFLAWAPGAVQPGQVEGARPADLTALVLRLLDLKAPPDLAGAWPPGPREGLAHA